ncbi:uncharacterized protein PEZ65_018126 [Lycodopsis pacificus]
MNGGGGADSQTGVLGSFGGGASHWDYIVISSGVTAAPSADQNSGTSLDSLADTAHHSDINIDQSGPDHSSLSSGPDQSLSSSLSASGSSHSAAQGDAADSSSSSHSEAHRVQTDGADSADTNGNGRQSLLTNTNAGGPESGLDVELTGLRLGHDVTESPPTVLHTDTLPSASHGYSQTDLVTMATDSTGRVIGKLHPPTWLTDRSEVKPVVKLLVFVVSADPTGTPFDSSHPAVTDHTEMAGSVTEQYNPSGQGPEGAENVELEDTC